MKKFSALSRARIAVAALALFATACGGGGSIEVEDARFRLSRNDLGAGYFAVTNSTGDDVTLQAVSAAGVGRIELHESLAADDGTMAMEARPEGFVVPAGETVTLQPGGKHLMLFDPQGTDDLTLELDFGSETIEVLAAYDAEASAAAMDSMDEMDHSDMEDVDHGDDDAMDDDAMGDMEDMDHSDDDAMDDDAMGDMESDS